MYKGNNYYERVEILTLCFVYSILLTISQSIIKSRKNKDIFHHTFPIFVHRNVGDKFCIRACVAKACLSKSRRVTNLIVSVWLVFCLVCFSVVSRIGCVTLMIKVSLPLPNIVLVKWYKKVIWSRLYLICTWHIFQNLGQYEIQNRPFWHPLLWEPILRWTPKRSADPSQGSTRIPSNSIEPPV